MRAAFPPNVSAPPRARPCFYQSQRRSRGVTQDTATSKCRIPTNAAFARKLVIALKVARPRGQVKSASCSPRSAPSKPIKRNANPCVPLVLVTTLRAEVGKKTPRKRTLLPIHPVTVAIAANISKRWFAVAGNPKLVSMCSGWLPRHTPPTTRLSMLVTLPTYQSAVLSARQVSSLLPRLVLMLALTPRSYMFVAARTLAMHASTCSGSANCLYQSMVSHAALPRRRWFTTFAPERRHSTQLCRRRPSSAAFAPLLKRLISREECTACMFGLISFFSLGSRRRILLASF